MCLSADLPHRGNNVAEIKMWFHPQQGLLVPLLMTAALWQPVLVRHCTHSPLIRHLTQGLCPLSSSLSTATSCLGMRGKNIRPPPSTSSLIQIYFQRARLHRLASPQRVTVHWTLHWLLHSSKSGFQYRLQWGGRQTETSWLAVFSGKGWEQLTVKTLEAQLSGLFANWTFFCRGQTEKTKLFELR